MKTKSLIPIEAQEQIDNIVKICAKRKPLLAINCPTFCHEKYLADALEGFVMQKTDFPFVAIVHDDASTDGTADIIREYARKYPDIIIPIIETENQYSKHDGSLGRIMNRACEDTGAIYYALCEGDDYWTDPYKLQKQVDFLESHPDYSLCFANARLHYEDTGLSEDHFHLENREYQPIEVYKNWLVPTPTMVFRTDVYKSDIYKELRKIKKAVFGDLTLYMALTRLGKLYGMSDIVAGYRRFSSGATNYLWEHPYLHYHNRICVAKYFGKEFVKIDVDRFTVYFIPTLKKLKKFNGDDYRFVVDLLRRNPVGCLKEFIWIWRGFKKRLSKLAP